jgi:hypothetical protein
VETAVVETTVEVETEEEDINILFNHILKRCQCKLTPFLLHSIVVIYCYCSGARRDACKDALQCVSTKIRIFFYKLATSQSPTSLVE